MDRLTINIKPYNKPMGYYIETPGQLHGKAKWILANAPGTTQVAGPITGNAESIPVVVVDNGLFEAAGIAFDKQELEAFSEPDDIRPKKYLLVPRAEVIKLCPSVEQRLNW